MPLHCNDRSGGREPQMISEGIYHEESFETALAGRGRPGLGGIRTACSPDRSVCHYRDEDLGKCHQQCFFHGGIKFGHFVSVRPTMAYGSCLTTQQVNVDGATS